MKTSILLIDDDEQFIGDLTFLLEDEFICKHALNSNDGIKLINEFHPDLILLDLMLDNENGIDILKKIKSIDNDIPVVMITEYASIETAVEAMRLGADDYISKTPNLNELQLIIEKSLRKKIDKLKERTLKEEINKTYNKIIGESKIVKEIKTKINLIAQSNSTVLITGESGTGKELIARSIHEKSDRRNELFVAINCGALPDNLIESELFGHEQGSFSGAIKKKLGKFEIALNGTIFLDEIGELQPEAQVKLMRVIQEKEFERVGGNQTIKTNARLIAATNRPLLSMVKNGSFRKDLYYRLDVFPIHAAPLKDRKEDIPQLVEYYKKTISNEINLPEPIIEPALLKKFQQYDWPGNIRELINYLTRIIILSKNGSPSDNLLNNPSVNENLPTEEIPLIWKEMDELRKNAAASASRKVELSFAKALLSKFDGNISKAAEHAGIDRTNLHRIIKRCNINTSEYQKN